MIRLTIVVEGQTEEAFVNEILQEHLQRLDIYATPILLRTSKTGRGGVSTFAKIENQVSRLCKEDTGAYVTTMLDYSCHLAEVRHCRNPGRYSAARGQYSDYLTARS